MALKVESIQIEAPLPEIKPTMRVYQVRSASFEERQPVINRFRELLNLGDVLPIQIRESLHLASEHGEVHFYQPSGGIWAYDGREDDKYENETRPWKAAEVKDEQEPGNFKQILDQDELNQLENETRELFSGMNLLTDQAYFAGVELDQVTQFDENGKETGRFPGEATARFLYSVDGLRVAGGGAKTYAFYNPGDDKPKLSGSFHCWREIQKAITVNTTPIDEVLANALAGDKEIAAYQDKGYDIFVTKIELVYYARPPYKFQDYLFPALNVHGAAAPQDEKLKDLGIDIVKFYHAIPISKYVKAGFAADYLVNRI